MGKADVKNFFSTKRFSEKTTLGSILTTALTGAGLYFGLSLEVSMGIATAMVALLPE